jgi:hypothetical protein
MKVAKLDWSRAGRVLVPVIANGKMRAELTEPFIYGTYLEVWWRCLKFSKEFTQSCRTGIFTSPSAFKTYSIFGSLEDITYPEWWQCKGHEFFGESITALQVTLFIKRKQEDVYEITVDALQDVSTHLAGKEFGFWLDQIFLLNAKTGLLSDAPLSWPIFRSRITYETIAQLLSIMEIHDQIIRNAPQTKLWQIGEQMKLNPQAIVKKGDFLSDVADKHKVMGQTVSNYLKKGHGLVANACNGVFPKY